MRTLAPLGMSEGHAQEVLGSSARLARALRSPALLQRLALAAVTAITLLIGSGGWVRLSSSGLGCPTWPNCTKTTLVAPDRYHALVEFVNRCAITTVGVVIGAAVIAALLRRPRRKDLILLAVGLVAGYVGEAVLGGITVLLKLAPALVAAHLVLAMALLTDAVVLHWRARREPVAGEPGAWRARASARSPGDALRALAERAGTTVLLADLCLATTWLLVVAGTVVTGSGPHSGSPGTPRFGFPFRATAEFHAVIGTFLLGAVVGLGFLVHTRHRPLFARYRVVLGLLLLQGALGYATWFSHVQVDVTEAHIVGAALFLVMLVRLRLGLAASRERHQDETEAAVPALT